VVGTGEGPPRGSGRKCWTEPRHRTHPSRVDIVGAIEQIRKIERQYAPAEGMTPAAYAAQLTQARERIADGEFRIAVGDDGVGEAVVRVLCVRYGLTPFRRPRQRASSLSVLAPEVFVRCSRGSNRGHSRCAHERDAFDRQPDLHWVAVGQGRLSDATRPAAAAEGAGERHVGSMIAPRRSRTSRGPKRCATTACSRRRQSSQAREVTSQRGVRSLSRARP